MGSRSANGHVFIGKGRWIDYCIRKLKKQIKWRQKKLAKLVALKKGAGCDRK